MSAPAEPRPSRPIRFVHRGAVQEVSGLPATTTVLQWLREATHCTGTKEGCAEGDCGACTVVIEAPDGARAPVKACLMTLGQAHGQALRSVEGLSAPDGAPHPVVALQPAGVAIERHAVGQVPAGGRHQAGDARGMQVFNQLAQAGVVHLVAQLWGRKGGNHSHPDPGEIAHETLQCKRITTVR